MVIKKKYCELSNVIQEKTTVRQKKNKKKHFLFIKQRTRETNATLTEGMTKNKQVDEKYVQK